MKWLDGYSFLSAQVGRGTWNTTHANRIFAVSKRFVRFLWELRLIELPRNLDKKTLAFTLSPREIEIFTDAEVRALWAVVANQTRVDVALSLNCGMTAKDINDLRQEQVD